MYLALPDTYAHIGHKECIGCNLGQKKDHHVRPHTHDKKPDSNFGQPDFFHNVCSSHWLSFGQYAAAGGHAGLPYGVLVLLAFLIFSSKPDNSKDVRSGLAAGSPCACPSVRPYLSAPSCQPGHECCRPGDIPAYLRSPPRTSGSRRKGSDPYASKVREYRHRSFPQP